MADEDAARHLTGLNIILTINGARLFIRNKVLYILSSIYAILALIKRCHYGFFVFFNNSYSENSPLVTLLFISFVSSSIIHNVKTLWDRKRIESVFKDMVSNLSDLDLKRIRRFSFIVSLFYWIDVTILEVGYSSFTNQHHANLTHISYGNPPEYLNWFFESLQFWENFLITWSGLPISFFCFMFYVKYKTTLHSFNEIKNSKYSKLFQEEFKQINRIKSIHNEFESLFNYIPALILTYLFIELTGDWIYFRTGKMSSKSTFVFIMDISLISFQWIAPLIMILFVDNLQESIKGEGDSLIEHVRSNKQMTNYGQLLIHELQSVSQQSISVYGLFPVSKALILSFIGSVTTFTVLLIQLSDKKI